MIGVGSADWPDILEAKAFNDEYGCYISAPPGTGVAYPSQLGGIYFGEYGIKDFEGITDKLELQENSGNAFKTIEKGTEFTLEADELNKDKVVVVDGITINFVATGKGQYALSIKNPLVGANPTDVYYDMMKNGRLDVVTGRLYCSWGAPSGNWSFDPIDGSARLDHLGFVNDSDKAKALQRMLGTKIYNNLLKIGQPQQDVDANQFTDEAMGKLAELLVRGYYVGPGEDVQGNPVTDKTYKIAFPVTDLLYSATSIRDETYAYIMQKSMTEKVTNLKISSIGYDKYLYDQLFPYIAKDIAGTYTDQSIYNALKDKTVAVWFPKDDAGTPNDPSDDEPGYFDYIATLELTGSEDANKYAVWTIVTDNYRTQRFTCARGLKLIYSNIKNPAYDPDDPLSPKKYMKVDNKGVVLVPTVETDSKTTTYVYQGTALIDYDTAKSVDNYDACYKVFYVESVDSILHAMTEEEYLILAEGDEDKAEALYARGLGTNTSAVKDWRFNTIGFSCSEEVYKGKQTSGGEFLGSLDEQGKDSYGSNIYLPSILSDDDFSFIEVKVLTKFDPSDTKQPFLNGFWTAGRIVDPYDLDDDGFVPSERNVKLEGDRYATFVQKLNLLERKIGCAWRDEWYQIIMDGIQEGSKDEYDDVYIYAEPTGQETFKTKLLTLRNPPQSESGDSGLATVISPYLVTPDSRGNVTKEMAERFVVSARSKGVALYAGEFEVYDAVSSKNYFRMPIGDVACNLARIMDKKLGGWAPAWYNITGELGGQLKTVCRRARYNFEDGATHVMDTKGINPIVYNSDDGVMILSHRSTTDPNNMTDWSYLGHSMSFDLCKREIRDNVMRPQIVKPINPYWMGIRQTQVDAILAKRTGGTSPIWSYAKCDIANSQTTTSRLQKKFRIAVELRVYVFSELVELTMTNLAQE
jgi:hypothetical protein